MRLTPTPLAGSEPTAAAHIRPSQARTSDAGSGPGGSTRGSRSRTTPILLVRLAAADLLVLGVRHGAARPAGHGPERQPRTTAPDRSAPAVDGPGTRGPCRPANGPRILPQREQRAPERVGVEAADGVEVARHPHVGLEQGRLLVVDVVAGCSAPARAPGPGPARGAACSGRDGARSGAAARRGRTRRPDRR